MPRLPYPASQIREEREKGGKEEREKGMWWRLNPHKDCTLGMSRKAYHRVLLV